MEKEVSRAFKVRYKSKSNVTLCQRKLMEESRWGEKEVEVKRMTDKIKNKCYVGIRGIYTTPLIFNSQMSPFTN